MTRKNEMFELKRVVFTDNVLINFSIDSDLSNIQILFEAYYQLTEESSGVDKKILNCRLINIKNSNFEINDEFSEDLKRSYSKCRNDIKSNEIYSFTEAVVGKNKFIQFKSDLLNFTVTCERVELEEGVIT